jgi:hypothetical protein
MFPWLSTLLRLHPPQPWTSLLLFLWFLHLDRFDFHFKAASRVPLQRLYTVPATYTPYDCLDRYSGLFHAFPLPLICAVIVVILVNFRHFRGGSLSFSSCVLTWSRSWRDLTPCPLNTSPVLEKHRRVVWYLLLIADTDRSFQLLIIDSIIIATVKRTVERVCALRPVCSRRTSILQTANWNSIALIIRNYLNITCVIKSNSSRPGSRTGIWSRTPPGAIIPYTKECSISKTPVTSG